MKPVQYTVRLPIALDKVLRAQAERQGISVYAMLQRSVKAGLTARANPSALDSSNREVIAELASVSAHILDFERMLDRTLFTACAAYYYARSAGLGERTTDEIAAGAINEAYDRQRRLSQGTRP